MNIIDNLIVEKIQEAFKEKYVLKIINLDENDRINKLNELGFKNCLEVKKYLEIKEQIEDEQNIVNLFHKYSKLFPDNNFITYKRLSEILVSFKLIEKNLSDFKGNVPDIRLNEILTFKKEVEEKNINGTFRIIADKSNFETTDKIDLDYFIIVYHIYEEENTFTYLVVSI